MVMVRILVSIFIAAIVLGAIYLGGWVMLLLGLAFALYSQYEIHNVSKLNEKPVLSIINYTAAILILPMVYFLGLNGGFAVIAIYMILLCVVSVLECDFSEVPKALLCFIYPQMFFIFLYAMSLNKNIAFVQFTLIFTLLSATMTDTFAFFCGKFFGKHKLCPQISPKKTIEGAVGGIIFSVIITLSFGILAGEIFGVYLGILKTAGIAVILSIFSEFGDLTASMIKRTYGVKDFGNLLPGHGGILDRIDSVIFIMPIAYFLFGNL